MNYKWKVVPLCKEQLTDVNPKDILSNGVFRKCNIYKSGGGYDKFNSIYKRRTGLEINPKQFVVQLYGCHLECPYCYVTPNGIWGNYIEYTSEELIKEFLKTDCDVFHLMGGSPALYIEYWHELISILNDSGNYVFHSDLLLTEKLYDKTSLKSISKYNCLYAVNIKGVTPFDYKRNTGKDLDELMFFLNLCSLNIYKIPFYITFTNPDTRYYKEFISILKTVFGDKILEDLFVIDIINYNATKGEFNK